MIEYSRKGSDKGAEHYSCCDASTDEEEKCVFYRDFKGSIKRFDYAG